MTTREEIDQMIAREDFDSAFAAAQILSSQAPGDPNLRGLVAALEYRRENWKQAAFHAREAARLSPEHSKQYRFIITVSEQRLGNMLREPENEAMLWHTGRDVSRYPYRDADFADLASLIDKFVVPAKRPKSKPFSDRSNLLTLGSCFATELRLHMEARGQQPSGLWVPEGLNNSYALRQFIEWGVTGKPSDDAYWYDATENGHAYKWTPEHEQQEYQAKFAAADGLVITIGLAEIWEDSETGGVFWRGVPRQIFEPGRYRCRMSTVEENQVNMQRIIDCVRAVYPTKPIIFTLSPVPLKATFRKESCVMADCVSKSILRVALHNVISVSDDNTYYWPSFEIVKWIGNHLETPTFGVDAVDQQHVSRFIVPYIVNAFYDHFFA